MHPNHKRSFHSKSDLNEPDKNSNAKLKNSLSDETCLNNNNKTMKQSPCSKSLDGLNSFNEKKKELSHEFAVFRKKCKQSTSPKLFRSMSEKRSDSPTANPMRMSKSNGVVTISPRKIVKSLSPTLPNKKTEIARVLKAAKTKSTELNQASSNLKEEDPSPEINKLENEKQQTRANPVTSPSKSKTDKMDLEHQRMMRAKRIASEALKVSF